MLLQPEWLWYFFPPFVGIQTMTESPEEELEELDFLPQRVHFPLL